MSPKILVPTDFSPTAETAFRLAVELADQSGGEVVLIHVYTPLKNPFIDSTDSRQQYNDQNIAELRLKLEQSKANVPTKNAQTRISTELGRSPITETILNYASSSNFSLIIMGTQGASGLQKAVIGSEAGRIIENTVLPVLLVPENFKGGLPKNIVLATTCNVSHNRALATLLEITRSIDPTISIIHVCENPEHQKIELAAFSEDVSLINNSDRLSFHHLLSAYETETMDELDDSYDMTVMLRRKRNFLGRLFVQSRSKKMAYLTDQLLLVIPEE